MCLCTSIAAPMTSLDNSFSSIWHSFASLRLCGENSYSLAFASSARMALITES
jgi:hypothetical protein